MAGHPTIGTAFALVREKRIAPGTKTITLTLGTGPTQVFFEWNRHTPQFVWMNQQVPSFGSIPGNLAALASALDIGESSVRATGLPVQEVSSGVPFLFVPVDSRAAVNRASVDRSALRLFFAESGLPELPVFVFSLEPAADDATAFSRMFAPLFGIPEDAATGGASGPLGAYLVHHRVVSPAQALRMVSLQGVAMGRPSRIVISVAVQDGTIADVRVGGTCVLVGRGFIDLPDESDQP
jgi:trans-2,3-dihydro-3-hydroxyanthranilate isomerase